MSGMLEYRRKIILERSGHMAKEYGANSQGKKNNRNRIFRYICGHDRVSNPELSYEFKISLPTVMQNTRELMEMGLIEEAGELKSTGGRRAKALSVAADAKQAIGLDITRNHIGLVLTNLKGEILKYERIPLRYEDCDAYYREVNRQIEQLVETDSAKSGHILGLGISIPGILDLQRSVITVSYMLGLVSKPFDSVSRHFPYPCVFLNDANAGAYAEGIRTDAPDRFFYLSLSNTVGGAVYHDGKLVQGRHFRCGEAGHMTVVPDGERCYCGKKGCLDVYCSAKRLAEISGGKLEKFFDGLAAGEEKNIRVWDRYTDYLAMAANNIHMMLDCDIIMGGYVGAYAEDYLQDICRKVSVRNTFEEDATFIKPCRYKNEAAALGAALQIIEEFVEQI